MSKEHFDVVIVGAGLAGLYMLHRARSQGLSAVVLERGDGVGGTWYWNRYPGARCDVESMEYSYTFSEELQQEWSWSERYSGQPEILRYINHVADRFDLRKDIRFETHVKRAVFDEELSCWKVSSDCGELFQGRFLVMATGCLSSTNTPEIEGIKDFQGSVYHTGNWPHEEVDFTNQRVGIIGTGSSSIQAIPHIASACKSLTVFQRTPNYSIPAQNAPLDRKLEAKIKEHYQAFRARNRQMPAALGGRFSGNNQSALEASVEDHQREFSKRWEVGGFAFLGAFNDLTINKNSNEVAADYVREQIRKTVTDPATAELLCPDSTIGCKRLCLDSGYFETYNQQHVQLVDINQDPIVRLIERGIECKSTEHELDAVVFATGFDAMTGTLLRIDIRGRSGATLQDAWHAGPQTYLGLTTAGFPNMFMISGPGSPSVLTNMIVSIEQHVEWIENCIVYMQEHQLATIDVVEQAQSDWVKYVNEIADLTLYPTCNSWYLGANIPGKPRVFMPHVGFPNYVARCEQVVEEGYSGFSFCG